MQIIKNMKQPENADECESIWCDECTYDEDLNCKGLREGWIK